MIEARSGVLLGALGATVAVSPIMGALVTLLATVVALAVALADRVARDEVWAAPDRRATILEP